MFQDLFPHTKNAIPEDSCLPKQQAPGLLCASTSLKRSSGVLRVCRVGRGAGAPARKLHLLPARHGLAPHHWPHWALNAHICRARQFVSLSCPYFLLATVTAPPQKRQWNYFLSCVCPTWGCLWKPGDSVCPLTAGILDRGQGERESCTEALPCLLPLAGMSQASYCWNSLHSTIFLSWLIAVGDYFFLSW